MKKGKTEHEVRHEFEERQARILLKQYLEDDPEASWGDTAWDRTKKAAKKTGEALGQAAVEVAKEAAGWVDAGLGLIGVPIDRPKPRRKRNSYI